LHDLTPRHFGFLVVVLPGSASWVTTRRRERCKFGKKIADTSNKTVSVPPPAVAHCLQVQKLARRKMFALPMSTPEPALTAAVVTECSSLAGTASTFQRESDSDLLRNCSASALHSAQRSRCAETGCASVAESSPSSHREAVCTARTARQASFDPPANVAINGSSLPYVPSIDVAGFGVTGFSASEFSGVPFMALLSRACESRTSAGNASCIGTRPCRSLLVMSGNGEKFPQAK